jgi:hypothetical protein
MISSITNITLAALCFFYTTADFDITKLVQKRMQKEIFQVVQVFNSKTALI